MAGRSYFTRAALVCVLLLAALARSAAAGEPVRSRWVREAGLNLGYGTGETQQGRYSFVSVLPRVGLDLGEALALAGLRPPGVLEVVIEPLVNLATEPAFDYEAGVGLLFKWGYRLGPFMPFVEAGAGVISMNDLVREQAPGCNFIPQIGPGLHLFLTRGWALTLAWRFRHLSDCGLSARNHGVNTDIFLVGATYLFAPAGSTACTLLRPHYRKWRLCVRRGAGG